MYICIQVCICVYLIYNIPSHFMSIHLLLVKFIFKYLLNLYLVRKIYDFYLASELSHSEANVLMIGEIMDTHTHPLGCIYIKTRTSLNLIIYSNQVTNTLASEETKRAGRKKKLFYIIKNNSRKRRLICQTCEEKTQMN